MRLEVKRRGIGGFRKGSRAAEWDRETEAEGERVIQGEWSGTEGQNQDETGVQGRQKWRVLSKAVMLLAQNSHWSVFVRFISPPIISFEFLVPLTSIYNTVQSFFCLFLK